MILRRSKCRSNLAIKKKATTESSPRTAAHFKSIASAISPRRLLQFAREWSSLILSRTARLRCQDTAKSVNHVAIVAVDYVPIGGLHFQTIARRPRATAQHAPITIGCAAAAFVSIEAPFPNVSAEIVKAYRIRFETAGRHCRATASSRGCVAPAACLEPSGRGSGPAQRPAWRWQGAGRRRSASPRPTAPARRSPGRPRPARRLCPPRCAASASIPKS